MFLMSVSCFMKNLFLLFLRLKAEHSIGIYSHGLDSKAEKIVLSPASTVHKTVAKNRYLALPVVEVDSLFEMDTEFENFENLEVGV